MRQLIGKTILSGLLIISWGAVAAPEMRCLTNGAYIKLYGKTEAENREVCERQGGELTSYDEKQHTGGVDQRARAMESIYGRKLPGSASR
ncbi:MAG: hypothetical protein EXR86_06065 [Gammaproteobacteria bacterium]|nr:hypothetical protein [Gammaproteobacteria bacterium]